MTRKVRFGGAWVDVGSVAGEAGLLARYADQAGALNVNRASSAYARVHDSLKVNFVGPASGKVLVRMVANMLTNGNSLGQWRLQDAAGTAVPLSDGCILFGNGAAGDCESWLLLDVTPGQSYEWYWAHACGYGSSINTRSTGSGPGTDGYHTGGIVFDVFDPAEYCLAYGRRTTSGNFTGDPGFDVDIVGPASGQIEVVGSGLADAGAGYVQLFSAGVAFRSDAYSYYANRSPGRMRGAGSFRVGVTPAQAYDLDVRPQGANCAVGNFGTSQYCAFVREVPAAA